MDRTGKISSEFFRQRDILPAKVVGIPHHSALGIHRSRTSDSHAGKLALLCPDLSKQIFHQIRHIFYDLLIRTFYHCRHGTLRQDLLILIHDSCLNIRSS